MRKLLLVLALLLMAGGGVMAQDVDPEYPMLTELASEPIPPRDRLELAERLRGVTHIPAPPDTPPDGRSRMR